MNIKASALSRNNDVSGFFQYIFYFFLYYKPFWLHLYPSLKIQSMQLA